MLACDCLLLKDRNPIDFWVVILYHVTIINLLITRSFTVVAVAVIVAVVSVNTLGLAMWTIISSANKESFMYLFPICRLFWLLLYCTC